MSLSAWVAADEPTTDPAVGQIYKCRGPDGADVYSDKPCGSTADMQRIPIAPAPLPDIAEVRALCASEQGARRELAALDRDVLAGLPAGQRRGIADALADYARWGSRAGARWGRGEQGTVHLCLPTFANEMVEFIATPDGKLVQLRGGMLSYRNDPDTPAALLERCADTFRQCLANAESSADSCVAQLPTCDAGEPWKGGRNCCPRECKDAYAQRRKRGATSDTAFLGLLYATPSCMPGLRATDTR
ncbi:MAG: hypothetical protein DYH17_00375 [Xanthomonadales bacterium PRO6]|nr:hypothetical protein [Xanthomonadales bacterium PRO6]